MNNFNNQWQNNWSPYGPSTNLTYVTSIDEALMKTSQRNSEYVYFDQDRPVFYRVKVDQDGRKAWQVFEYTQPNPDVSTPATKADVASLLDRIQRLENELRKDTSNEQSNGQSAVQ